MGEILPNSCEILPFIKSIQVNISEQNITYSKVRLFVLFLFILSSQALFAINPKRDYVATPQAIGVKYLNEKISAGNGIIINSWVCLQKDRDKPYIIISGSDAGNMSNSLGQLSALYKSGYNVILYDYRGFGESSDFEMDPNMLYYKEFADDLSNVISFTISQYNAKSIYLYGLSMGTIISRMNLDYDSAVKGLILDSFVIDPILVKDRISEVKKKHLVLADGADEYRKSNKRALKKPVLLFSGTRDVITKTEDYREFLTANPSTKFVSWDCDHLQCFTAMNKHSDVYVKEIEKFIKEK